MPSRAPNPLPGAQSPECLAVEENLQGSSRQLSFYHVARGAYALETPAVLLGVASAYIQHPVCTGQTPHSSSPYASLCFILILSRNPLPLTGHANPLYAAMSSHAPAAYTPPRHRLGGVECSRRRARTPHTSSASSAFRAGREGMVVKILRNRAYRRPVSRC